MAVFGLRFLPMPVPETFTKIYFVQSNHGLQTHGIRGNMRRPKTPGHSPMKGSPAVMYDNSFFDEGPQSPSAAGAEQVQHPLFNISGDLWCS